MEKGEKVKVSDLALVLALLRASDGVVEGRTRLQKMVYLLKNSFNIPFGFEFRMYFYGPYSDSLADALQLLKSVELVEENMVEIARGVVQYNYRLTDAGQEFLKSYFPNIEMYQKIYEKIKLGVKRMSNLPTSYLASVSKRHYAGIEKAFYFFRSERPDGFTGEFAVSLEQFIEKIKRIDLESLVFHFYRGDFEKWFLEVLKADKLAEEMNRLRRKNPPINELRKLLCDVVLASEV
jgi:hypothetical protein